MPDDKYTEWAKALRLDDVDDLFRSRGCTDVRIKFLSPNDNSKNQIWFGNDLVEVSGLPTGDTLAVAGRSMRPGAAGKPIFHVALDFAWALPTIDTIPSAPKFIFYPQYPEVRFSGMLAGSSGGPNELLDPNRMGRAPGRVLLLGYCDEATRVTGLLLPPDSVAVEEGRLEWTR